VTYSFTDEIWTTPEVPSEMKDVQEFDSVSAKNDAGVDTKDLLSSMQNMRNNSGMMMAQLFGSKPGAADAFAQMGKELAKIKGTRLIEITRMGGTGLASINRVQMAPSAGAECSSVAGQVATNTAQNTTSARLPRPPVTSAALVGQL